LYQKQYGKHVFVNSFAILQQFLSNMQLQTTLIDSSLGASDSIPLRRLRNSGEKSTNLEKLEKSTNLEKPQHFEHKITLNGGVNMDITMSDDVIELDLDSDDDIAAFNNQTNPVFNKNQNFQNKNQKFHKKQTAKIDSKLQFVVPIVDMCVQLLHDPISPLVNSVLLPQKELVSSFSHSTLPFHIHSVFKHQVKRVGMVVDCGEGLNEQSLEIEAQNQDPQQNLQTLARNQDPQNQQDSQNQQNLPNNTLKTPFNNNFNKQFDIFPFLWPFLFFKTLPAWLYYFILDHGVVFYPYTSHLTPHSVFSAKIDQPQLIFRQYQQTGVDLNPNSDTHNGTSGNNVNTMLDDDKDANLNKIEECCEIGKQNDKNQQMNNLVLKSQQLAVYSHLSNHHPLYTINNSVIQQNSQSESNFSNFGQNFAKTRSNSQNRLQIPQYPVYQLGPVIRTTFQCGFIKLIHLPQMRLPSSQYQQDFENSNNSTTNPSVFNIFQNAQNLVNFPPNSNFSHTLHHNQQYLNNFSNNFNNFSNFAQFRENNPTLRSNLLVQFFSQYTLGYMCQIAGNHMGNLLHVVQGRKDKDLTKIENSEKLSNFDENSENVSNTGLIRFSSVSSNLSNSSFEGVGSNTGNGHQNSIFDQNRQNQYNFAQNQQNNTTSRPTSPSKTKGTFNSLGKKSTTGQNSNNLFEKTPFQFQNNTLDSSNYALLNNIPINLNNIYNYITSPVPNHSSTSQKTEKIEKIEKYNFSQNSSNLPESPYPGFQIDSNSSARLSLNYISSDLLRKMALALVTSRSLGHYEIGLKLHSSKRTDNALINPQLYPPLNSHLYTNSNSEFGLQNQASTGQNSHGAFGQNFAQNQKNSIFAHLYRNQYRNQINNPLNITTLNSCLQLAPFSPPSENSKIHQNGQKPLNFDNLLNLNLFDLHHFNTTNEALDSFRVKFQTSYRSNCVSTQFIIKLDEVYGVLYSILRQNCIKTNQIHFNHISHTPTSNPNGSTRTKKSQFFQPFSPQSLRAHFQQQLSNMAPFQSIPAHFLSQHNFHCLHHLLIQTHYSQSLHLNSLLTAPLPAFSTPFVANINNYDSNQEITQNHDKLTPQLTQIPTQTQLNYILATADAMGGGIDFRPTITSFYMNSNNNTLITLSSDGISNALTTQPTLVPITDGKLAESVGDFVGNVVFRACEENLNKIEKNADLMDDGLVDDGIARQVNEEVLQTKVLKSEESCEKNRQILQKSEKLLENVKLLDSIIGYIPSQHAQCLDQIYGNHVIKLIDNNGQKTEIGEKSDNLTQTTLTLQNNSLTTEFVGNFHDAAFFNALSSDIRGSAEFRRVKRDLVKKGLHTISQLFTLYSLGSVLVPSHNIKARVMNNDQYHMGNPIVDLNSSYNNFHQNNPQLPSKLNNPYTQSMTPFTTTLFNSATIDVAIPLAQNGRNDHNFEDETFENFGLFGQNDENEQIGQGSEGMDVRRYVDYPLAVVTSNQHLYSINKPQSQQKFQQNRRFQHQNHIYSIDDANWGQNLHDFDRVDMICDECNYSHSSCVCLIGQITYDTTLTCMDCLHESLMSNSSLLNEQFGHNSQRFINFDQNDKFYNFNPFNDNLSDVNSFSHFRHHVNRNSHINPCNYSNLGSFHDNHISAVLRPNSDLSSNQFNNELNNRHSIHHTDQHAENQSINNTNPIVVENHNTEFNNKIEIQSKTINNSNLVVENDGNGNVNNSYHDCNHSHDTNTHNFNKNHENSDQVLISTQQHYQIFSTPINNKSNLICNNKTQTGNKNTNFSDSNDSGKHPLSNQFNTSYLSLTPSPQLSSLLNTTNFTVNASNGQHQPTQPNSTTQNVITTPESMVQSTHTNIVPHYQYGWLISDSFGNSIVILDKILDSSNLEQNFQNPTNFHNFPKNFNQFDASTTSAHIDMNDGDLNTTMVTPFTDHFGQNYNQNSQISNHHGISDKNTKIEKNRDNFTNLQNISNDFRSNEVSNDFRSNEVIVPATYSLKYQLDDNDNNFDDLMFNINLNTNSTVNSGLKSNNNVIHNTENQNGNDTDGISGLTRTNATVFSTNIIDINAQVELSTQNETTTNNSRINNQHADTTTTIPSTPVIPTRPQRGAAKRAMNNIQQQQGNANNNKDQNQNNAKSNLKQATESPKVDNYVNPVYHFEIHQPIQIRVKKTVERTQINDPQDHHENKHHAADSSQITITTPNTLNITNLDEDGSEILTKTTISHLMLTRIVTISTETHSTLALSSLSTLRWNHSGASDNLSSIVALLPAQR
jgi:hypothetical protein